MAKPPINPLYPAAAAGARAATGTTASAGVATGEVVGSAGGVFSAMTPVTRIIEPVVGLAYNVDLGIMGLGGAAWAAGKLGDKTKSTKLIGLKETLEKPNKFLNPEALVKAEKPTLGTKITNGALATGTVIGAYGVAKGFAEEMDSLKHMVADTTGKNVHQLSNNQVLFGKVPEHLKETRDKLRNEYLLRGALQLVGIGLVARGIKKNKVGMLEFFAPQGASMVADMAFGQSVMPVYAGIKNAYNRGEELPPEVYAEFVFAASKDLKSRGDVGKIVASKLGDEYAAQKFDPGKILQEIETGAFMQRVQGVIVEAEKEQAEMAAKYAQAKAEQEQAKHADAKHPQKKHADALQYSSSQSAKVVKERPVVGDGKFTGKFNDQSQTLSQGIS